MRSDYQEKKEARIERLKQRAANAEAESTARYNNARRIGDCIPMGQPILVGHHSEKRHRRDIEKIDNSMRASVEASKKAEYYSDRAEAAENNTAISSDDPNSLQKLREKLAKLQELQDLYKKIRKATKDYAKNPQSLFASGLSEKMQRAIIEYADSGYAWSKQPVASYQLTNNNANMKRIKERIEKLERLENTQDSEEQIGDVKIVGNASENRVQIFFPGKPEEATRKELKSYGFRWSPTNGCWQAYYSERAKRIAKQIVTTIAA